MVGPSLPQADRGNNSPWKSQKLSRGTKGNPALEIRKCIACDKGVSTELFHFDNN